eukprot:g5313.t1
MPLIYPWRTAYGEDAAIHSVLCRMSSGSVDGWGESAPFAAPCYSPEWAGGIFALNRDWLAPTIVGQSIETGDDLQDRLAIFKGNPFAKAVLDTAWWSLRSRIAGEPLHRLLGATRDEVPIGADFGVMDDVSELLPDVARAVEEGFPRIKLKFRPGWDLNVLAAVRDAHPDHVFHIDCNSGYRLADTPLFQEVDRFGLAMIEQPLQNDDLNDHAELQRAIKTPVCLDESVTHPRQVEQAIALKSCRYVNVKPGRVGGLTNAVKIHDICQNAGIPCWVGGMLESSTGAALCTALAMLDNFSYPADIFPSARFYHDDMSSPPLELHRSAEGRLDMAMKLAGFALEEKREVFIFFNVKGVHVPTKDFSADVKFKDNDPIKEQLAKLIERGAVVHVCPICMKGLGVEKDDIIDGAKVTTRSQLHFPMQLGELTIETVSGGRFWIDGGAMFGVVPRALWSRYCPPDENHNIAQDTNCVLVRGGGRTILIDTGYGSKLHDKQRKIFHSEEGDPLLRSLEARGVSADDVDTVILSHLHFDHAGGATIYNADENLEATFPNAEYVAQRREWANATAGYPELRGVYPLENLLPLERDNRLRLVDGNEELVPGIRAWVTGGHTEAHSAIVIESGGETAIYLGDLCPTSHHLPTLWGMSYDVDMLQLRRMKAEVLGRVADKNWLALFDHDPDIRAARLTRDSRRDFALKEPIEMY